MRLYGPRRIQAVVKLYGDTMDQFRRSDQVHAPNKNLLEVAHGLGVISHLFLCMAA